MELHLIRHGETDWNRERRVQGQSDSRLTERGARQARALAPRLRALRLDRIYCSTSLRARQTAGHLFDGADIEYLDSLREIRLGPWEGRLYDQVEASEPEAFRRFWREPHRFAADGAETFFELQRRALEAVEAMAGRHPGGAVAVVSHGALIKSLLCRFEGRPMAELWAPPRLHNCAHSIVRFGRDGGRRIVQYADRPAESARPAP